MDSLKYFLSQKPRIAFRFDSKTSFISNSGTSIWGVNLGLDFSKKLKTGIGYYFLYPQLNRKINITGIVSSDSLANAKLDFRYGGIFGEYVFYNSYYWDMCFTVHFGVGVSQYRYEIAARSFNTDPSIMGLYEAQISAQYRVLYWLGLGGGIGYRLMLISNNYSDESYTSPIYTTKIKIFFGDLYRKHFPKK